MSSSKHLIIKCWNCGQWNFYCDEPECDCGVRNYEESDCTCPEGQACEFREVDLKNIDIEKLTQVEGE